MGLTPRGPNRPPAVCCLPDFQAALLQEVNAARARARSCGSTAMLAVSPLAWDARLFSAAARHSTDMAVHDYFSHTGRSGSTYGRYWTMVLARP